MLLLDPAVRPAHHLGHKKGQSSDPADPLTRTKKKAQAQQQSDSAGNTTPRTASWEGANGTFSGVLKSVEPRKRKFKVGKLTFYVVKGTKIIGDGRTCGKPHTPNAATKCTLGQLEKAVQKRNVHAKVTLVRGYAKRVVILFGMHATQDQPAPRR
jgi:hypothetical protein